MPPRPGEEARHSVSACACGRDYHLYHLFYPPLTLTIIISDPEPTAGDLSNTHIRTFVFCVSSPWFQARVVFDYDSTTAFISASRVLRLSARHSMPGSARTSS